MINSDRLELRLFQLSEITAFIDLCRAEGFDDFTTGRFQNMNLENAKNFILTEQDNFNRLSLGRLGVFLKSTDVPVGICGLYQMTDPKFLGQIGIAYRFPKSYWGKGYGTESGLALLNYGFENLKLSSISAIINPINQPSIRVVEKIGMRFVGDVNYKNELRQHWEVASTNYSLPLRK